MARFYGGASASQDRPFKRRRRQATPQELLASAEGYLERLKQAGAETNLPWWVERQEAIVARLREEAKLRR